MTMGRIVNGTPADRSAIRSAVAGRASEIGGAVAEDEITVSFLDGAPAGCRLFHASWGADGARQWLSGLIRDQGAPETLAGRAVAAIFARWIEADGKLPDAAEVARGTAYLLDAAGRHAVILTEADKARVTRDDWRAQVRLPETIVEAGRAGVGFWWVGPRGPSRMRVLAAEGGEIRSEETFVQDMAGTDGAQS